MHVEIVSTGNHVVAARQVQTGVCRKQPVQLRDIRSVMPHRQPARAGNDPAIPSINLGGCDVFRLPAANTAA